MNSQTKVGISSVSSIIPSNSLNLSVDVIIINYNFLFWSLCPLFADIISALCTSVSIESNIVPGMKYTQNK